MFCRKNIYFFTLGVFVLILSIFFSHQVAKILSPFFIAFIISYIAIPFVRLFEVGRLGRIFGTLVFYLILFAITYIYSRMMLPSILNSMRELFDSLPGYIAVFDRKLLSLLSGINHEPFLNVQALTAGLSGYLSNGAMGLFQSVSNSVTTIASGLSNVFIAIVLSFYFIKDRELIQEGFLSLVPSKNRQGVVDLGREINQVIASVIRGQLLVAIILSLLMTIVLSAFSVKYAPLLGFLTGLLDIIPYFGGVFALVPIVLVAGLQSPVKALWVTVVFLIIQQIQASVIAPKIIGRSIGIHPAMGILAILSGGHFFGIWGMLVAIPVFGIIKVVLKRCIELTHFANQSSHQ